MSRFNQNQVAKYISVIAVIANAMAHDIEKGYEAGFDDYITKPISVKQLIE